MLTLLIDESTRRDVPLQKIMQGLADFSALFPAIGKTAMAAEEAPITMQEVSSSIQDTVLGMWADFDVEQAVKVIESALRSCDSIRKDEEIQIFPHAFGAGSIDIEVAWWTDPLPVDIRRSRGEVVAAIKRALDDAGIEIPFPYRTLTFKETLKTDVVGLSKEGKEEDR